MSEQRTVAHSRNERAKRGSEQQIKCPCGQTSSKTGRFFEDIEVTYFLGLRADGHLPGLPSHHDYQIVTAATRCKGCQRVIFTADQRAEFHRKMQEKMLI